MAWNRRHLLGTEDLTQDEINAVMDLATELAPIATEGTTGRSDLAGKTVANLFFEPSTRTKTSFSLAAGRLGARVVGGASDGNLTSPHTATLDGLGAVGDGAHREDEHVVIDTMPERAALLALLLITPVGGSP